MAKFLHVADVHLGFDRYDCKERTLDFFYAFQDALERYAIADAVDFVLIAGDLFEHRMIQPAILSQAQICLERLQEKEIPVLAIEGNHDNRPFGTKTNWLRYLCDLGLLILLEPETQENGELRFAAWDQESKTGGYIDLPCGVRVIGSCWYGANAPRAIAQIADAIAKLPLPPNHTIMMFHHGLEGQISRYAGALRYLDVLPLKEVGIEYLALGHIHKYYVLEDWIFNPGSIEANNIEEAQHERGVLQVELTNQGIKAILKQDYYQRPIHRLKIQLQGHETPESIQSQAVEEIRKQITSRQLNPESQPIIELKIEGQSGINNLDLNLRDLRSQLQSLSQALIMLLKWNADTKTYESPISKTEKLDIESDIFKDILSAHSIYKNRAIQLSSKLIDLKSMSLENNPEEEIYSFIAKVMTDKLDQ